MKAGRGQVRTLALLLTSVAALGGLHGRAAAWEIAPDCSHIRLDNNQYQFFAVSEVLPTGVFFVAIGHNEPWLWPGMSLFYDFTGDAPAMIAVTPERLVLETPYVLLNVEPAAELPRFLERVGQNTAVEITWGSATGLDILSFPLAGAAEAIEQFTACMGG